MSRTACAFTGHRPNKLPWKYNEADNRCIALKAALKEQIIRLAEAGITDYYSGGAEGIDCIAAEIVLELRKENPALKLHCILPYEGQADKWSSIAQERHRLIFEQADSVEYLSRAYYDGCMIDRNHRLVEAAGILLAVYKNGTRRSGTGATVNYARRLGREIIVVHPATLCITYESPKVYLPEFPFNSPPQS